MKITEEIQQRSRDLVRETRTSKTVGDKIHNTFHAAPAREGYLQAAEDVADHTGNPENPYWYGASAAISVSPGHELALTDEGTELAVEDLRRSAYQHLVLADCLEKSWRAVIERAKELYFEHMAPGSEMAPGDLQEHWEQLTDDQRAKWIKKAGGVPIS